MHKGFCGAHSIFPTLSIKVVEDREDYVGDLPRKVRWNGIPDLDVLLGTVAEEGVVVWKGLQPSRFAHRQAAAL